VGKTEKKLLKSQTLNMEKSQINNEELLREFKELKERLQLKIENEMDQIKSDQHSSIARM
jgi:hypothetical protein